MIPVFALMTAALYGFRKYLFKHLVFATHFYTFVLLMFLSTAYGFGFLAKMAARLGRPMSGYFLENAASGFALVVIAVYLVIALRKAHGGSKLATALRALILTAAFFPILLSYRFLLFLSLSRACIRDMIFSG